MFFNYISMEACAKVVFCGPIGHGVPELMEFLFKAFPGEVRSQRTTLRTTPEVTSWFDVRSDMRIGPFALRFLFYSCPFLEEYDLTAKLILKGVDGLVVAFDPHLGVGREAQAFLAQLPQRLSAHFYIGETEQKASDLPLIILSKRDIFEGVSLAEAVAASLRLKELPRVYHPVDATESPLETLRPFLSDLCGYVVRQFRAKGVVPWYASKSTRDPSTSLIIPALVPEPARRG